MEITMTKTKILLLAATLLAGSARVALAGPMMGKPVGKPVSISGTVRHFTLSPFGAIVGLQLSNGAQVLAPPFMSTQIAYAVKLGDQVMVQGVTMGTVTRALRITDATSHQSVTLPKRPFRHHGATAAIVQGTVASLIDGPRMKHFGVMLSNGTELALPPTAFADAALSGLLKPGAQLVASGAEHTSALGTVLKVNKLGADSNHLTMVAWPHWHHGHAWQRPKPAAQ
jgi:hypothetical protein